MDKHHVIDILEQMATLLELSGANTFKVRAYQNGARALETFDGNLAEALGNGELKAVKGIGAGLFADIKTLVETDSLPEFATLKAQTPPGLIEMMEIPGLGPKKVRAIHEGLGIESVGELEYACNENRLVDLPGFGEKTQAKILKSIDSWKKNRGRHLYAEVVSLAEGLEAGLAKLPAIQRVAIAGSVRRRKETVKDLDLVASSDDPKAVMAAFVKLPGIEEVELTGDTKTTVRLTNGMTADLRVVTDDDYPFLLFHFTGSKPFNVAMRQRANDMGLSLNEYGLWRGEERIAAHDEAAIFELLGLAYVPPEMREDWGEIALAEKGPLPTLVEPGDLQGVFHVHSNYSDGETSIKEMALKAKALGYRYIGISDHSEAAFYAHGLTRERIKQQQDEIRQLNQELDGITILSGIEADILADGSLDYDDETLATFDFVIGSVHSRFSQDREAMTKRLVNALSNPRLTMLGHMTGRLLLSRDPYDFDLDAVLEAAKAHGKIIELNANPHRLDIDWRDLRKAREMGIAISINPDAHSPGGLEHTRFGVDIARKGGLTAKDVFNTRPLDQVLTAFKR